MEIFIWNKILLKISGLSANSATSKSRWIPYFWTLGVAAILIPSVNYLKENLADLADTTDVYYVITGATQTLVKFYVLWSRIEDVYHLFEALQRIVDESKCLGTALKLIMM